MERDNRKSHLAPQLSPATQDLLRSSDSPTYQTQAEDRTIPTPTSGDIPIGGAGIISPRDYPSRSPSRNGNGNGNGSSRAPASTQHPGMNIRVAMANSAPQTSHYSDTSGPGSAGPAMFSLPVRPGPPGNPLPPPPPLARRQTPDDFRRETRRQATFGLPPNPSPSYGL
jgi:mitogen-activated protein kinase kinase